MVNMCVKLKKLRISSNLTQTQVSKRIGIVVSAVSSYESGTRFPSLEMLIKLADLFHVSTDYLLGIEHSRQLNLDGLTDEEIDVLAHTAELLRCRQK